MAPARCVCVCVFVICISVKKTSHLLIIILYYIIIYSFAPKYSTGKGNMCDNK